MARPAYVNWCKPMYIRNICQMFEQNSLPLFTIWLIVCWTCMLPGQYCRYLQYPTLTESWNIRIVWFIESPTPTRCFDNKHWYTPANQRHWISLSNWIEFLNKCVLTKDCLLEAAILDDLTSPVRTRGRCSRCFYFETNMPWVTGGCIF